MTKEERFLTLQIRREHPDRPMQVCLWDAKRWIHFRATTAAQIKEHKRRSAAAKKAWKKRRAA